MAVHIYLYFFFLVVVSEGGVENYVNGTRHVYVRIIPIPLRIHGTMTTLMEHYNILMCVVGIASDHHEIYA